MAWACIHLRLSLGRGGVKKKREFCQKITYIHEVFDIFREFAIINPYNLI